MQYKSPIKALSPFLQRGEDFEKTDFGILKKRIFAEFELSGKSTIRSKYGELSKNDFIRLIEDIEYTDNLKYHLIIFEQKRLITLLEQNKLKEKTFFNEECFENEGFVEFLSPHFAHSLGSYLSSCLNKKSVYYPVYFKKNLPVSIIHEHLMVEPITNALHTLIEKVETMRARHLTKRMVNRAVIYFSPDLILLINSLPKRLFLNVTEIYAQSGMRFVFKFLQRGEKKYTTLNKIRNMINLLHQINVNEEVKKKFKNELNKYHTILNKKSSNMVLLRIFLFFLAFMFLLRLISIIVEIIL